MITYDGYFDFEKEGVWVYVPPQVGVDALLDVSVLPADITADMWKDAGFQPMRIIGNLKAIREPASGFSPRLQVRVRYSCMDVFRAMTRGKHLALAYWDGRCWVRYNEREHGFRLEPPAPCGHAYFELAWIGDPAISWGT